jgi:hypothetical protein
MMARVYSVHTISLKSGASGAEFERFFGEEVGASQAPKGLAIRLLKGDRGDREGKYLVMFEFESVERRNELFPEAGPGAREASPEFLQWMSEAGPTMAKWDQYTTPLDMVYTDYVVV